MVPVGTMLEENGPVGARCYTKLPDCGCHIPDIEAADPSSRYLPVPESQEVRFAKSNASGFLVIRGTLQGLVRETNMFTSRQRALPT
jgi:hypothetical protein